MEGNIEVKTSDIEENDALQPGMFYEDGKLYVVSSEYNKGRKFSELNTSFDLDQDLAVALYNEIVRVFSGIEAPVDTIKEVPDDMDAGTYIETGKYQDVCELDDGTCIYAGYIVTEDDSEVISIAVKPTDGDLKVFNMHKDYIM